MKPYILFAVLLLANHLSAQNNVEIKGVVLDRLDSTGINAANVYFRKNNIGTFTNELGQFSILIPDSLTNDTLVVSCIGYNSFRAKVLDLSARSIQKILLEPQFIQLDEVTISTSSDYAKEIVEQVVRKLPANFQKKQFYLEAFYRELAIRDSTYVRLVEAAVGIQDFGYGSEIERRKINLLELRKSEDYLTYGAGSSLVKFLFGEDNMLYHTINQDFFRNYKDQPKLAIIDKVSFTDEYEFKVDGYTTLNADSLIVIKFRSDDLDLSRPYYEGKLYINLHDYGIVRMDYGMLANPGSTFKSQNNVYYQGKFFFKATIDYRVINSKYFLSRVTFTKPKNFDAVDNGKGQQFVIYDLSVHNIFTQKKDFDRIRKRDSQKKDIDLYEQNFPYNADFWKNYNLIILNPLLRKAKDDLEQKKTLDQQFKKNEK